MERSEEQAAVEAARAGDPEAFAALAERYRRPLRAHCYRMLGSADDAEDLVQETMLRAWRGRASFEGRSLFRTWLYRIATNACLNALERAPRRVLPQDVASPVTAATPGSEARPAPRWAPEVPWLQPFPDRLLDLPGPDAGPEAAIEARETVALAFLAALQHLPPRQRAILVLTEVLGWSAAEVAEQLGGSVAAVNSALQRARATLRARRPADGRAPAASGEEQAVLARWMRAWEEDDAAALTAMLRDDARWAMPPAPLWFDGRAAIEELLRRFPPGWQGRSFRMVATGANGQPAAAAYVRGAGEATFRLTSLHVLRVVDEGRIAEITTFSPELCAAFALPPELPPIDR